MIIRIENLKKKWNQEKPLNGNIQPKKALSILESYSTIFNQVQNDWDQTCSAMDLLGVEYSESLALSTMQEERENMVEVWTLLSAIWDKIHAQFQLRFVDVTPQSLRSLLNSLNKDLQNMPNVVRQYEGWSYLMKTLRNILNTLPTIEGLKSQAVQPRHWQQISQQFRSKIDLEKLAHKVLSKIDKQESESYVINPKSVTKDTLFGCLDPVTRKWTDGVFTRILRTIVSNQKGEMKKRHWIVFDGDVDPEWVENLNSVLAKKN